MRREEWLGSSRPLYFVFCTGVGLLLSFFLVRKGEQEWVGKEREDERETLSEVMTVSDHSSGFWWLYVFVSREEEGEGGTVVRWRLFYLTYVSSVRVGFLDLMMVGLDVGGGQCLFRLSTTICTKP